MLANKVQALVLAAGQGSRFKTGKSKMLEKICGQEMILYTTRLLESLNIPTTVILGYQRDVVQDVLKEQHGNWLTYAIQEEQKGTGHAVLVTRNYWTREHILILNGDMPLVTTDIIEQLYQKHWDSNADISFVTTHLADESAAYGRVIEDENGIRIIEAKDFQGNLSEHCCINAGIYLIRKSFLESAIAQLQASSVTHELYITDLVKIASEEKRIVTTVSAPHDVVRGVNNFHELWAAEHIKRGQLIKHWMEHGVHFSVAQNVHLDLDVQIGSGSYIGCGVHLLANTRIGKNCKIHEFSSLENINLGDKSEILPFCILKDSNIGNGTTVGPYAHIRENTIIGDNAIIGNFVEIKKSTIGNETKAKHLTYLGDAHIGNQVNIGAGTITCNHDGKTKHTTTIADHAYIGSNTTLVAPVIVGENAFTAAGSVITDTVPADALALGRARQINKEGYAIGLRGTAKKDTKRTGFVNSFMAAIHTKNSGADQQ